LRDVRTAQIGDVIDKYETTNLLQTNRQKAQKTKQTALEQYERWKTDVDALSKQTIADWRKCYPKGWDPVQEACQSN